MLQEGFLEDFFQNIMLLSNNILKIKMGSQKNKGCKKAMFSYFLFLFPLKPKNTINQPQLRTNFDK